jgi:hypothetical protein
LTALQALTRETLIASANGDGGWGYRTGTTSRLEPTCWSLLALGPGEEPSFFTRCQGADGLLRETTQLPANRAFNALALLVALEQPALMRDADRDRLLAALVRDAGMTFSHSDAVRQDNGLIGWPWIDHTFSWVEPTAWCVLALKKRIARAPEAANARAIGSRIDQAERLLIDRSCVAGGWNYGNSAVLGHDLQPYVPTTAVTLLALQDRRDHPVVRQGLEFLWRNRVAEPSGLALALTVICLRIHGLDAADTSERLLECWDETRFLGNLHVSAMAVCAQSACSGSGRTPIDAFHV